MTTIQITTANVSIPAMLAVHNLAMTQATARRMINGGVVKINGKTIEAQEYFADVKFPADIEIGKHKLLVVANPKMEYVRYLG